MRPDRLISLLSETLRVTTAVPRRRIAPKEDVKALYRVWKQDGEAAFAASRSHVLDDAVSAGAGRVETLELGHRYGHLSPLAAIA
jgi:hypothetical protein